jgi:hypothetical protein
MLRRFPKIAMVVLTSAALWLAADSNGAAQTDAAAEPRPARPLAKETDPPESPSTTAWRKNKRTTVADASDEGESSPARRYEDDEENDAPAEDAAAPPAPKRDVARVISGKGTLPTGDGQLWREYDITPYTSRITSTARPEQAIVDWVLRETGYEVWHMEPLGFLSANQNTLTVYHTPEMQAVVHDVVDRFVNPEAATNAFGLRVITIENPNWRARAQKYLTPVPVETQGIQAWLVHREDAAMLLAEARKRTDYREHSSPNLLVTNGESTVVTASRARSYVREVQIKSAVGWPGFESEVGQIDEGFSLELSPLLSLDGSTIDAVLKCSIDQVERMVPVVIDVPTPAAPRQRTKVEVPQISHCRVHERFRWPADQVLLISLGMVATPVPTEPNPLRLPIPGTLGPPRADLLVAVENRGKIEQVPAVTRAGGGEVKSYHGRY